VGVYYIFDRPARRLQTLLLRRSPLEGVTLAKERTEDINVRIYQSEMMDRRLRPRASNAS